MSTSDNTKVILVKESKKLGRSKDITTSDGKTFVKVLSSSFPQNFVLNQLRNGKTIFERLEAAHVLIQHPPSSKIALENMKKTLLEDYPWPVSVEAIKVLDSSIKRGNEDEETYEYLKQSLNDTNDPRIRREIIDSIGNFKRKDSFALLKGVVQNANADPYERYSAAIAISTTSHEESVPLLKSLANTTSFHNLVARGAIEGLKILAINSKEGLREDIENFIIEKAKNTKESRLRRSASSALGYLGRYVENKSKITEQLKSLLHDDSFYVRNTACVALANALENTEDSAAIQELRNVAEKDSDSQVRSTARVCINIIRSQPEEKEKQRLNLLGQETKIDSTYKSEKFDLLEQINIYH